jgi:hypothetical protein
VPHMRSSLLEDLAIPYTLIMSSVEENGSWLRRAEYPELPGCVAESYSAVDAIELIDALRVRMIVDMRERGEEPPRPRPPLISGLAIIGSLNLDQFLAGNFDEAVALPRT